MSSSRWSSRILWASDPAVSFRSASSALFSSFWALLRWAQVPQKDQSLVLFIEVIFCKLPRLHRLKDNWCRRGDSKSISTFTHRTIALCVSFAFLGLQVTVLLASSLYLFHVGVWGIPLAYFVVEFNDFAVVETDTYDDEHDDSCDSQQEGDQEDDPGGSCHAVWFNIAELCPEKASAAAASAKIGIRTTSTHYYSKI